jgi:hypothetical protein
LLSGVAVGFFAVDEDGFWVRDYYTLYWRLSVRGLHEMVCFILLIE